MIAHPKATTANWINLSKKYLLIFKGKNIFSKLPFMCKQYFGIWKTNNIVQSTVKRMEIKYKELLNMLVNARSETLELVDNNIQTIQMDNIQQKNNPFQVPPRNSPMQEKYVCTKILQQKQRKCA